MSDVEAVLAQIRYELRNPINTILGYSQLLLEDGDSSPLSAAERHGLEGVADAGKQLLQTIGAMLDPAAVTDGIEEYAFRLRYATRVPLTTIRSCI
jgi:signal transduction histidine kinase